MELENSRSDPGCGSASTYMPVKVGKGGTIVMKSLYNMPGSGFGFTYVLSFKFTVTYMLCFSSL